MIPGNIYTGLDPSLLGCAISTFNDKNLIDTLFIRIEKGHILDRILLVRNYVRLFLIKHKVKFLIIETPYYNRFNAKTYGEQLRLYQQLIYLCIEMNIDFVEKNANSIKKFVIKGRATKDQTHEFFLENIKYRKFLDIEKFTEKEKEGILDSILIGMSNSKLSDFLE